MGLLNFVNRGQSMLGSRPATQLPAWAQQMYPGGAPGGNPGGVPMSNPMLPPQAGGTRPFGAPSSPSLADGNDRGGQGFGANGAPGNPGFSMQDILNSQAGIQNHGYFDLPKQFFDPKEMAIGAAVGQLPMGGMAANMAGAMYGAATGHPRSNTDIARGFVSSLPGVGGLMKLSEWYAGTPYAKNNPISSYYMGGNADPEAAKYTDSAYRSGFGANQMQSLYDAISAQKNLGGAGNVQGAIDAWRASNFNDGKIHIGEAGLQNPYAWDISPNSVVDNSGAGISTMDPGGYGIGFDPSAGATTQSGSPVDVSFGQQPGGPVLDQGMPYEDNSGAGGGGSK